tara:strand:+ start:13435 stop:14385 length:951 start_codon:yes stop_codon:yes gene_type:complete
MKCKICQKEFTTARGLHTHIRKIHGLSQAEYYKEFYPRKSWLTNKPIQFKNVKDYFSKNFNSPKELREWCLIEKQDKVKEHILKLLKDRIRDAELSCAPSHIELLLRGLPTIDIYKKIFGSYSEACRQASVEPMFPRPINHEIFSQKQDIDDIEIVIDTREQKPLSFKKSIEHKLDFGDYTCLGSRYTKTYIDRKSENDFKTTLSKGQLDRFTRELQRAKDFNSFLYILVEGSIEDIKRYNNCTFGGVKKSPHNFQLEFIWHNMRILQHEFRQNCQFIFSGSRANSTRLIPVLLKYGQALWQVDLQYYIDKYGINC